MGEKDELDSYTTVFLRVVKRLISGKLQSYAAEDGGGGIA